jgi:hypothetical protein
MGGYLNVPRLPMFSVTHSEVARGRLRGDSIRMPSKNLLDSHQLDVDLWTEFLCTWWR